ncbi:S-adenosyl-L-methionine-dependent methyltransferase [Neocallimastix lanati (nom. inval.)]|nr:S-adenosyl-L-methionine-dependent methyltransferase [Neocallimastix sp. JGI-2020a]
METKEKEKEKEKSSAPRILDVGAGTGLFSSIVLTKFPQAKIVLMDMTEKMLDIARDRFKGNENITYLCKDMTNIDEETSKTFENQFDYIISGLAIHHLTSHEKKYIYGKCQGWLKEGGLFINCDQVISPDPILEAKSIELWHDKIRESGIGEEAIDMLKERMKLDKCDTIQLQLEMFKEVGFKHAEILYKYLVFCVFYAYK